ncbi:tail fiber assembly protein, partial [Dysosmobacter welbionis]
NQFPPDCITGVNGSVLFAAYGIVHAVSLKEIISVNLVAGAEDMRQLMQKNVFQLCRMTRYVCAQKDSVRAVSCADECRGVKVKIAVLCISVFQPVREILLAELLKDFLLVFRLKAAQHKVVLAEL